MKRPKVLVFSSLLPLPIDRGDKNRLFHVLRLLSQFADVRLVCLRREWELQVSDLTSLQDVEVKGLPINKQEVILSGLKAFITNKPYMAFRYSARRVADFIDKEITEFKPNVFWAFQISAYPFLGMAKRMRRILDLVDSPSRYAAATLNSRAILFRAKIASIANWRITEFEGRALSESDKVLVNSPHDEQHLLRTHGMSDKIVVLPNCVPSALLENQWRPDYTHAPRLLFVANLAYPPHRSALINFALNIFPHIQEQVPNVELMVSGVGSSLVANQLGSLPSVRFTGFIDDLVGMYMNASLLVSPQSMVMGLQYKILEAMAIGLPVVASREVTEASLVTPNQELLVADTADEFVSATLSILGNKELAARLSANGRKFISEHYTWEKQSDLIHSLITQKCVFCK